MLRKSILFLSLILAILIACKKGVLPELPPDESETIEVGPGPEDIFWDTYEGRNRLLVSCNQRRDGMPDFGEIRALSLEDRSVKTLVRTAEPEGMPFNPHGFYLTEVSGEIFLYVINHYEDNALTNAIVSYKVGESTLEFVKEYKNELMISPNEVCALPNGGFYFSNDRGEGDFITENLFNKFGGSLVYCDVNGNCKYVDKKLAYPNGIEYKNSQLFLATSRHKALFKYDVSEDGSLSQRIKISTINGMDNLRWYGEDLIVAVHPDELAFLAHSLSNTIKSPSHIYTVNPETGESKAIYKNNGSQISGSSTAMVIDGNLYISQVFENYLLKVKL